MNNYKLKNKKVVSILMAILILFSSAMTVTYADISEHTNMENKHMNMKNKHISEHFDKSELYDICGNIPHKYIDELYDFGINYNEIKNINEQIDKYYLSDDEIEQYVKLLTNNTDSHLGKYPYDKDGNIITSNGSIPYQDIALRWRDFKVGDVRGTFRKINHYFVKIHDNKTNKTHYIPVYDAPNYQCFCVEDLGNCGFSHDWNAKNHTTNMTYDGKTFIGLSKQNKTAGDIYHSNVKVYINGQSILTYNIGGYSLADVNALRKILRTDADIEIVSEETMLLQNSDNLLAGSVEKNINENINTNINTNANIKNDENIADENINNDENNLDAALMQVRLKRYSNRKDNVNVSLPRFKVTVNGELMENDYNKYPCLVYEDITYFPMTYDYARFLGLKANWYEYSRMNEKGVLFIGVSDKSEIQNKLNTIRTTKKNKKNYTAKIADYGLLVNSIEYKDLINNKAEEYPILNFRGVSYFPLTWKYAVDEFGWEYHFDAKKGLWIDSEDPFRPVIYDKPIGFTMPYMPVASYVYGDDYYLVIPHSTYAPVANLVYRKRGENERVYNISEQLYSGKYAIIYLNMEKFLTDLGKVGFKESSPEINGNILSIRCEGRSREDDPKNPILEEILIKINLDTGKIISEEIVE